MKPNMLLWIVAALALMQPAVLGCRGDEPEEPDTEETVGEETEEAAEEAGEEAEEVGEEVEEEVEEAGEEVDEEL